MYFVGIDIAKRFHEATVIDEQVKASNFKIHTLATANLWTQSEN